ncbi:MAG: peptidase, partial [Eggerthellaceae bacterium]|nr:peptidase [Eggerthellaceae bacterium]
VTVELVDGEVGYIKLSQITSNSTELVEEAVKNLQEAGATCYVLDLRNNPGGYLTQAVDIGSLFLKSGVMVKIETKDSPETTREADTESITDAPLVIIINGKTAAAAEVLAGGLQDQSRATVVGETSMGKGSVQSIYHLSFGGALRYTSAYYKTPNGYEINNVGISPDVQVAMGSSSSDDAQKSLAVDTAKSLAQQS